MSTDQPENLTPPNNESEKGVRLALTTFIAKMKSIFSEEKKLEEEVKSIENRHQTAVIKNKIDHL